MSVRAAKRTEAQGRSFVVVALVAAFAAVATPACKRRDNVEDRFASALPASPNLRGLDRLRFEANEADKILRKRPRSWFTLRRAARLHLALAHFIGERDSHCKKSLQFSRRAIKGRSPIPAHRWLEIRALICLGRHAEAKKRIAALPPALSKAPLAARLAARAALVAGSLDEARAALAKAGSSPASKVLLAQLLRKSGRLTEARAQLSSVRAPRYFVRVSRARARVELALKNYKQARLFASRALEREPGYVPMLLLYARACKALGHSLQARQALAEARRLNSKLAVPPDLAELATTPKAAK